MNFFKKLFSGKSQNQDENKKGVPLKEVYTEDYHAKRYLEEKLDKSNELVDGSLKMLKSYFIDTQTEEPIVEPINHPKNMDAAVQEGMGFYRYCKLFEQEDKQIGLTLTMAFSLYMVENFGFVLYKDKSPEYPLRFMTLQFNNDGGVISIYPFEYSLKVLNGEASFNELVEKVKNNLQTIPTASEFLDNLKKDLFN